ncbi:hypothetical protein Peur_045661 [Populus x canadensis]
MSLGFKNSLFSGQFNTVQLGRFRPRSQKHSILSVEPVQTSVFSGYIVPRNIKSKIDSLGEVKLNKHFILRSKAVLTVDKEVDIEGNEGVSRERSDYDVIVIGSGIGGLVAATQLAVKGAKVLVLEKYVIPGGSSGYYERDGYTFDVGSSVMFGFSDKILLLFFSVWMVICRRFKWILPSSSGFWVSLPDFSNDFNLNACRTPHFPKEYSDFISELTAKFPHEKEGILKFYGECCKIFNALNSLELKSLEEPIYLLGQFFQKPLECLTLAYYLPQNAGDIAQKYMKDPELLSFIDAECFIGSTVNALQTPMINAGMVLCDRHFGGINYPVGGVGGIAKSLSKGLIDQGSEILYRANVTIIILEHGKAVGVRLSDGREFFSKTIISNATRWDTFGKLLKGETLPKEEENFQKVYVKAPSFLSIHMGVKAEVLPPDTDCHHFVLEDDWARLEEPYGSIFLSIPTVLDSSLAPEGRHILHIFTTSSIEDWEGLSTEDYEAKKKVVAYEIISRLEKKLFPGLRSSITFMEVHPRHRRYLARDKGTYGPMPRSTPKGLLGMPFNTTAVDGLYCVGDSCFPGQGVIAVAFSGVMCAHRVAADIGIEKRSPVMDAALLRLLGWLRTLA